MRSLTELSQGRKQSERCIFFANYVLWSRAPSSFSSSLSLPTSSTAYHLSFLLSIPSSPLFSALDYRLVVICSNKNEDKSHIISLLSHHKRHLPWLHDVAKYQEYLKIHFTGTTTLQSKSQGIHASTVDSERYVCVFCVTTYTQIHIHFCVTRQRQQAKLTYETMYTNKVVW